MVKHDIFSFCLRRSGHTAIMNWIASQAQPSHSLKDCNMSDNKLTTPVVHIMNDNKIKSEIYRYSKETKENGLVYLNREQRKEYLGKYKLLISAFEDSNHIRFETDGIRSIVKRYSLVENHKIVIVIRDPFNLFASRIWRNRKNLEVPFNDRAVDWFNMQLHQFETESDFIFIDYHFWTVNKNYREYLTRILGIPFTSDIFHRRQANISSFDEFNGRAVKDGFNNRWQQFLSKASSKQKDEYLRLLNKIDVSLASRYFMHIDCRKTFELIKEQI